MNEFSLSRCKQPTIFRRFIEEPIEKQKDMLCMFTDKGTRVKKKISTQATSLDSALLRCKLQVKKKYSFRITFSKRMYLFNLSPDYILLN